MGGMFQPTTTRESRVEIPSELSDYARQASQFLTGRLGQTGPAWPGPWTAEMSPQERYGLGGLEASYANAYPLQPISVQNYMNYLQGGAVPSAAGQQMAATMSGAYLPGANPYLAQIERGMGQEFQDSLAEAQNRLALAGHGGSSTAASVLGSRAVTDYLGKIGGLRLGAYEAERGRMADPRLLSLPYGAVETGLNYPVSLAQTLLQAGALPRTLGQQDIDKAYQEMQRLWNESYRGASQMPQGGGTATTQYGPSPFMSMISAMAPFFLPNP